MMVAFYTTHLVEFNVNIPLLFLRWFGAFFFARKPPCTYPLTHWRAQIAGLKMSMVLQALLIGLDRVGVYPLVKLYKKLLKMAIDIHLWLIYPVKNVIFHSYVAVYQRVPSGNETWHWANLDFSYQPSFSQDQMASHWYWCIHNGMGWDKNT